MFPEGGRSKDGSLLDAKRGTGLITALSGQKLSLLILTAQTQFYLPALNL